MKKTWINFNKINTFFSCPFRYKKMYLTVTDRQKGKWTPDRDVETLKKNIKKIFLEETKLFKGRKPRVFENIDFNDSRFNEDILRAFEKTLINFQNKHTLLNYTNYTKPLFLDYNDNIGFFTSIDFTIDVDKIPTAVILSFYGYQKTEDTIEENREHFFNAYILNKKLPEIRKILYIYPGYDNILLTDIHDTDIEEGKRNIEHFIHSLNTSEFKANPNGFCDYCDFQNICPAWREYPFELPQDKRKILFRLSYSKLDLFKRCPFAYKKVYIEKIPQRARDFFSIGTTIHSVMEELEKYDQPLSMGEIYNLYEEKWISAGFESAEDEKEKKNDTWEWFKKYLNEIAFNPYKKAKYTELYFQFPIKNKVIVNGFIDRIDQLEDGTYEIIDYKTEDTMRSQEEVDNDMQLSIYYWAAKKLNLNVSRLSLHFVRFQKVISTQRGEKDIKYIEESIDNWVDKILMENDFEPKKNKYCNHCDFRAICPLFNE